MKKLILPILFLSVLTANAQLSKFAKIAIGLGVPALTWAGYKINSRLKAAKVKKYQRAVHQDNLNKITSEMNPDNTAVVLDFHDVLAKRNLNIAFKAFGSMTISEKCKFLGRLAWFVKNRITKKDKCGLIPDYAFIDPKDSESYKEKALRLVNPFEPEPDRLKIVSDLKDKGFDVWVCSNIGDDSLDLLKEQYAEFKQLFEQDVKGVQNPNQDNGYINKKDANTYTSLRDRIKADRSGLQNMILVDDNVKKLAIAKKALGETATTVEFTSAADTQEVLSKLGLSK